MSSSPTFRPFASMLVLLGGACLSAPAAIADTLCGTGYVKSITHVNSGHYIDQDVYGLAIVLENVASTASSDHTFIAGYAGTATAPVNDGAVQAASYRLLAVALSAMHAHSPVALRSRTNCYDYATAANIKICQHEEDCS